MTTSVLRPNLTVAAVAMQIAGGAGSVHASLADGPDALNTTTGDTTNVYATGGSACTALCELSTVTLPAGAVTKSLTVRCRARANSGSTPGRMAADVRKADGTVLATHDVASYAASFAVKSGSPANVSLTQADVDGLRLYGRTNIQSYGGAYQVVWAGAAVDLVWVAAPTVTVTGPTGTVASSSATVAWTWDQPDVDGGAQSGWIVRVFSSAQHGAGGFDPATSTALAEKSGTAAVTSATVTGLPDGTNHRAYVRAYELINGVQHWSGWSFTTFTVTTTRAEVQSVTATAVPASNRVDLTVARNTGLDAWVQVDVERSAGGGPWTAVGSFVASGNSVTVADRLAPSDVSTVWRARAINASANAGGWVSSSALTWSATGMFLRDAANPATEWQFAGWEMDGFPTEEEELPQSVLDVIGRTDPVVVSDVRKWRGGSFKIECLTAADAAALVALCDGRQLMISQPASMGHAMTIVPSNIRRERGGGQIANERRFVTVDFQRVA